MNSCFVFLVYKPLWMNINVYDVIEKKVVLLYDIVAKIV